MHRRLKNRRKKNTVYSRSIFTSLCLQNRTSSLSSWSSPEFKKKKENHKLSLRQSRCLNVSATTMTMTHGDIVPYTQSTATRDILQTRHRVRKNLRVREIIGPGEIKLSLVRGQRQKKIVCRPNQRVVLMGSIWNIKTDNCEKKNEINHI